jgi:predicted GIY-YIG superfamily endonuclease
MLPAELKHLKLIPARKLLANLNCIPALPGIYLFFLCGGTRLLEVTGYFDTDAREPLTIRDGQHLYTGATHDLRRRLEQHFFRDSSGSSFRKTLLSIEHARHGVSKSRTPSCKIKGEATLSKWLFENGLVAIQPVPQPFEREGELIGRYVSPLNITLRKQHPYSHALMGWRSVAFPPYGSPLGRRAFKSGARS